MNKKIFIFLIVVVLVGVGSFYGGMEYGKSKNPQGNVQGFRTGFNGMRRNSSQTGGGFVAGEIMNKDDKSITVRLNDGSSKIVFFSSTTKIMHSTEGTANDLVMGEQAVVNGTTNQDGSLTAQSIQIRPTPVNNNQ